MTELNGHPTPSPITEQRKVEPTRHLVVELRHGDVVVDTEDVSDEELLEECQRRGLSLYRASVSIRPCECPRNIRIAATMGSGEHIDGCPAEGQPSFLESIRSVVPPPIVVTSNEQFEKLTGEPTRFFDRPHPEPMIVKVDREERDTEPPVATEDEKEAPELGQAGNPERDARLVYRDVNGECARLGAMLDQAQEELLGAHCVTQAEARLGSALALTVEAVRVICERLGRVP